MKRVIFHSKPLVYQRVPQIGAIDHQTMGLFMIVLHDGIAKSGEYQLW